MKHAAEGEPRCSDTSCASEQNRSDKCTRRPPLPEGYFSVPPATVDQLNRLILDGRHPETETGPVANFRVARHPAGDIKGPSSGELFSFSGGRADLIVPASNSEIRR